MSTSCHDTGIRRRESETTSGLAVQQVHENGALESGTYAPGHPHEKVHLDPAAFGGVPMATRHRPPSRWQGWAVLGGIRATPA